MMAKLVFLLEFLTLSSLLSCSLLTPATVAINKTIHQVPVLESEPQSLVSGPDHLAAVGVNTPQTGTLVIFLPGTGSSPGSASLLLRAVLDLGHHVISLSYPNQIAMGTLALNDLDLYGSLRREICFGIDSGSLSLNVTPPDSILNRIEKLLIHLSHEYPGENWGNYIQSSGPRWDKIILSGFSQGSGHAAYLAQSFPVKKVVLFAGVVDGRVNVPQQSATWIASNFWATPRANFYFFSNTTDGNFPAIEANLFALGFDLNQSVDSDLPFNPETGNHIYLTKRNLGEKSHPSVCEDNATPLDSQGQPIFLPVWQVLFR